MAENTSILKRKLDQSEKKLIKQELIIASLETELSKRTNNDELRIIYEDYINSLNIQIQEQKEIINENKKRMKEQFSYLENNHNRLLQRYNEFRHSIVYPIFRFTHNFGKTRIGHIIQRLIK